jgi:Mg2+/Co2+ transporter CorB
MEPSSYSLCIALLFLLSLSTFFSLAEAAFISVSEEKIFKLNYDGIRSASTLLTLLKHRERTVSVSLLCDNIVNILASSLSTILFANLINDKELGIALSTVTMTMAIFIFGEVIPKTVGMRKATAISLAVAPLFKLIIKFFYPLMFIIEFFNNIFVKKFHIVHENETEDAGDSLLGAVELYHHRGTLQSAEKEMLSGVLSMDNVDIKDVMTHRNEMFAIDIKDEKRNILNKLLSSPYSRVPVYGQTHDNVLGTLSLKDFFTAIHKVDGNLDQLDLSSLIKKPWFIPGDASLISQLADFRKRGSIMAFVVDEYGGIMGIVTLEDILEQIVGDIVDENDKEDNPSILQQEDGSFIIDANMNLIQFNEKIGSRFKDDEVSSIGGFLINKVEKIPSQGEEFEINGYKITILETKANRVLKIKLIKMTNEEDK